VKEWLEFYVIERLIDWWHNLIAHQHQYSMSRMVIYKGEPREHPSGIPLVAWVYRCKCGEEVVDLTASGIRLLQQGVEYEALIEERL